MNNVVFKTGGDWDSTTLENNGREVLASQLFVELHAGRNDYGEPDRGGIGLGGQMTALIRPQDDPNLEMAIFPGRLEMQFPSHQLIIQNSHPGFAIEFTRVQIDNQDVTNSIVDVFVNINAVDNVVQAYAVIYKPHWLSSDEVVTYNLL